MVKCHACEMRFQVYYHVLCSSVVLIVHLPAVEALKYTITILALILGCGL